MPRSQVVRRLCRRGHSSLVAFCREGHQSPALGRLRRGVVGCQDPLRFRATGRQQAALLWLRSPYGDMYCANAVGRSRQVGRCALQKITGSISSANSAYVATTLCLRSTRVASCWAPTRHQSGHGGTAPRSRSELVFRVHGKAVRRNVDQPTPRKDRVHMSPRGVLGGQDPAFCGTRGITTSRAA